MKKIAFTLTELLVALAVIGILTAILMPIIFNIMPDQNALMAKRAYYTVQTIVSDMINDDNSYPDLRNTSEDEEIGAFSNGYGYANCEKWTEDGNANVKFIKLFADKLDIKGTLPTLTDENFQTTYSNDNPYKFKTKDGIEWIIPTGEAGIDSNNLYIIVDVNGDDKPNCMQKESFSSITTVCTDREKGFDRFLIIINSDGQLEIVDQWAIDAVDGTKSITGDED